MKTKSATLTLITSCLIAATVLIVIPNLAWSVNQPNVTGNWEGFVKFTSVQPKIILNLERSENGSLKGDISLPMQNQHNLPVSNITVEGDNISFDLSTGRATASFKGVYSAETHTISGDFSQAGQTFPFELIREGNAGAMSKK